jgi:hypothetical protein
LHGRFFSIRIEAVNAGQNTGVRRKKKGKATSKINKSFVPARSGQAWCLVLELKTIDCKRRMEKM